MAYKTIEIYTCDNCHYDQEVDGDNIWGMPEGWIVISRRLETEVESVSNDEDLTLERFVLTKEYCCLDCVYEAIDEGDLNAED